jgi:hypothetical protein
MDLNVEPKYDVPKWNETRWTGCWNPDAGVGLYLHMGRFRRDLDMWWAQTVAYLPESQLCVNRLWGRNASKAGVDLGSFAVEMTDDGWTSRIDSVGELTTWSALADAPRGSSAPSRSMQWEVTATAATSVWDMYDRGPERLLHAGDTHIQQGYDTSGWLRVDGHEYRLDGIGFKDHSSGARDLGNWHSHTFLMIVGPEWTAHLIVMADPQGEWMPSWGSLIRRDGGAEAIVRGEFPRMTDAYGGPIDSRLEFEIASGEQFAFDVELIHALPMTITVDNDNINGVDWEIGGNPMVLVEGNGRLAAADGSVLYCFHERSVRRSALEPARSALESAAAT